jgi:AcrR family transcriptional regulator
MASKGRKWRRRKEARPGEILAAALAVFAEKGFAAAKLEEIAARAGVVKGSLYLYFETKEDLFRAVVRDVIAPQFQAVAETAKQVDAPFTELVPQLLMRVARLSHEGRIPSIIKMVIGESRNFPDLGKIWHDDVLSPAIGAMAEPIALAQRRGEVRAGDARLHAFSLLGPMLMGILFREVFRDVPSDPPDLQALALQHAGTVLNGLLIPSMTSGGKDAAN